MLTINIERTNGLQAPSSAQLRVVEAHKGGKTAIEIADSLGYSESYVRRIIDAYTTQTLEIRVVG